ncbi:MULTISPECIES: ribosome biogenesis factor YjgA [Motilimonas]|uniref:Dual-action ribosomal maturation protein DarP n=1 Tax=Motilimonas cestriensis TaxID=2742685 RepID=A0ABS8WAJ1_9GAMM|nr:MULTISPECIES: ribosome biogenesis factor YjgA [Motilimonas]MCE0555790.1 ribosome-associated protein [Motilimonas sp. E26]MCE2596054.1 ribosome-associated protein [Motilimonas cestriensis]MDO6524161.1 ribosome biogenesis factor YjgA [Motilimonas sp. 1_MG-2023]
MHPEDENDIISKTQLKQESEALQKLGARLVSLSPSQLKNIPLSDNLSDAIKLAHKISNKHEALRRQLQYIGKLMRSEDPEPIEAALDVLTNKHQAATHAFHQLELLRDELISEGDEAISRLMEQQPSFERQKLRQLVRQANKEAAGNKPPKSSRELFKYLREIMVDKQG